MKLQLAVLAALALVAETLLGASPAAAFSPGFEPSSPGYRKPAPPSYGVPAPPAYQAPRTGGYGAPAAPKSPGFEPYKPFSGSSVYAHPNGSTPGAKPCETSVYVNACGRKR